MNLNLANDYFDHKTKPEMKKFTLIILIVFGFFNCTSQIITGYVSDEKTGTGIADALVCFDGTMYGTRTNRNGYFNLDISAYKSRPISVCSAGYYTVSFDIETYGKPFQIFMNPKRFIENAPDSIITDEETRQECIKLFRTTFLGKTRNAVDCEISNEDDIKFIIRGSVTLTAFTSEPLQINNKSLGYQILYYLDQFELTLKDETFSFSGTVFFKEDMSLTDSNNKKCVKKREQAYLKSRMCFFRSLWADALEKEGYIVKSAINEELTYNQVVLDNGIYGKCMKDYNRNPVSGNEGIPSIYIVFREKEANYDSWGRLDRSCITEISVYDDVYFDATGYFDPASISWRGKLAVQRIADLLPLEYKQGSGHRAQDERQKVQGVRSRDIIAH
jgi:hypothetical protein